MCRTTDNHSFYYQNPNQKRDRLKIKAFYLRLLLSNSNTTTTTTPKTITLHYLPRISGSPLEINGFKIRSNLDAFVTLHRVRSSAANELVFASRECVRVSEAVRFQVYFREDKVLKGIFRKDQHQDCKWKWKWKLQCDCALPQRVGVGVGVGGVIIDSINEAEVSVEAEEHVAIIEKVDMKKRIKCNINRIIGFNSNKGFILLDEIPEEREEDEFYCSCDEENEIGEDDFTVKSEGHLIHQMEEQQQQQQGMGWALDVGIWVMCFGVGLLVSKASSKRLTRRLIL